MPETSSLQYGITALLGTASKSANRGLGNFLKQKGFASFTLTGSTRFTNAKSGFARDLFSRHVMKSAYRRSGFPGNAAEFPNQLLVRAANHHGERFPLVAKGGDLGKVAGRDHDGAAVLHDEGIRIANGPAQSFDFGSGLASAKHQRNIAAAQFLQSGTGPFPGIGIVIEQSPIQVSEDESARAFKDDETPLLLRRRNVP